MQRILTILLLVAAALFGLTTCEGSYVDPGALEMLGGTNGGGFPGGGGFGGGSGGGGDGDGWDGGGNTGTAPTITTTTLPDGTVGTAYSQTLAAIGTAPITWSIATGTLPGGLYLSTAGVISGNPTTANTFNFTVKATNAAGSDTKTLSIVIASSSGGDSLTINITNLTASTEYKVRPALQTSNASGMHDKVATSDASGTLTVTFTKDDFASFWGRDMYIFYAPSNTFSILDGKHTKTTYKMETKTLTLHGVDDFQSR